MFASTALTWLFVWRANVRLHEGNDVVEEDNTV
jgi:hypothetical protein